MHLLWFLKDKRKDENMYTILVIEQTTSHQVYCFWNDAK